MVFTELVDHVVKTFSIKQEYRKELEIDLQKVISSKKDVVEKNKLFFETINKYFLKDKI